MSDLQAKTARPACGTIKDFMAILETLRGCVAYADFLDPHYSSPDNKMGSTLVIGKAGSVGAPSRFVMPVSGPDRETIIHELLTSEKAGRARVIFVTDLHLLLRRMRPSRDPSPKSEMWEPSHAKDYHDLPYLAKIKENIVDGAFVLSWHGKYAKWGDWNGNQSTRPSLAQLAAEVSGGDIAQMYMTLWMEMEFKARLYHDHFWRSIVRAYAAHERRHIMVYQRMRDQDGFVVPDGPLVKQKAFLLYDFFGCTSQGRLKAVTHTCGDSRLSLFSHFNTKRGEPEPKALGDGGTPTQRMVAKNKWGQEVRSQLIEADPGTVLINVDFRAHEICVLAALSGDDKLNELLDNNEDVYMAVGKAAGLVHDDSGYTRQDFKDFVLASLYGSGVKRFIKEEGMSTESVGKLRDAMKQLFPALAAYEMELKEELRAKGYVVTVTGKRIYTDKGYAILNAVVQSVAADICNLAFARVLAKSWSYVKPILHQHDGFLFQVDQAKLESATPWVVVGKDENGADIMGRPKNAPLTTMDRLVHITAGYGPREDETFGALANEKLSEDAKAEIVECLEQDYLYNYTWKSPGSSVKSSEVIHIFQHDNRRKARWGPGFKTPLRLRAEVKITDRWV